MANYRYGPYVYGPDPLALPYDVRGALDEMGDAILSGATPADSLRDLLRKGSAGRRGLDDLLRRARERQREIRGSGRLDGILDQARALLDTAIGQERAELFPDPSDEARMREADLDALPPDTAQAIRRLADYDWRSPAARETFERLRQLLRSEVLDSQFRGMRQALQSPDPQAMQRIKDMLGDLNEMLAADQRGEHTQADFDRFMERYGDLFPDNPRNLEELVDSLVSRMAAAERLLRSLSEEQRRELAELMADALGDAGLESEMARLWATRPQPWPSSPTWPSWRTRSGRITRARAWTILTRTRSGGPSGGRPWMTSRPCAASSVSWNGRDTSAVAADVSSSRPRRFAGSVTRPCAGSSPT
jgi:uncharacterized protein with von Willebrand factor type A (vWA) domain